MCYTNLVFLSDKCVIISDFNLITRPLVLLQNNQVNNYEKVNDRIGQEQGNSMLPPSDSFRTKLSSSSNITRPMFWNSYLFFVRADYLDILQYLTTIYWEYSL